MTVQFRKQHLSYAINLITCQFIVGALLHVACSITLFFNLNVFMAYKKVKFLAYIIMGKVWWPRVCSLVYNESPAPDELDEGWCESPSCSGCEHLAMSYSCHCHVGDIRAVMRASITSTPNKPPLHNNKWRWEAVSASKQTRSAI